MKRRFLTGTVFAAFLFSASLTSMPPSAQTGSSVKIQHGTVTASRSVTIETQGNAAKGVVVGGTIGMIAGGSSGKRSRRRAATGAVIGGAAAASNTQQQQAMEYTVDIGGGAKIKVLTDQTQIHKGDCVVVEESGGMANVRRVSAVMCEPESESVVQHQDLRQELQEEAAECIAAKERLLEAETDEALDRALRMISILCDN